jgi:hypothetical protein
LVSCSSNAVDVQVNGHVQVNDNSTDASDRLAASTAEADDDDDEDCFGDFFDEALAENSSGS